jgi:RND family efflux transporter MFP subunit
MRKRRFFFAGGALIAISGAAAVATLALSTDGNAIASDPRLHAPVVRLATPTRAAGQERGFTGVVGARVQTNLGFRVSGKIVERLVDTGQRVTAGQPLMRIDETDLQLALTAKRNAVAATRAVLVQATADEARYASLVKNGLAVSRQQYDQSKAALDTAEAQLAAAEAEARLAENQAAYSVLKANADGTIVEALGEPGQVVSVGQTVVRLAEAGPREAIVALPETIRPPIGAVAEASVYGAEDRRHSAHLRQLSDSADPQTRTFEARFVLDGAAAAAPLGATVTVRLTGPTARPDVQVPLGALLDDGQKTGVWLFSHATSTVQFKPVKIVRMSSESAVISGVEPGQPVVSVGAHLLHDGASVRTTAEGGSNG